MVESAADIRRRAQRARRLSKTTHDKAAAASLEQLAADLMERARELEVEASALATRAEMAQQHAAVARVTAAKITAEVAENRKKKL